MVRLVVFIVVFVIFLGFIVLNLPNKCDVSLGFAAFKDVPIFISCLVSFVLGMLVTIPLILARGKGRKKPEKEKPIKKSKSPVEVKDFGDELKKEDSPYGID